MKNDEYFMELNEDDTTSICSSCAGTKGENGGIVRMKHPFTIGSWNSCKENL